MKGILADNDIQSQVAYLVDLMDAEPWRELWRDVNLVLLHFEHLGLLSTAKDVDIWMRCQANDVALITGNRTLSGPDSLEATIRQHNNNTCLPVFTISDVKKVNVSRAFAEQIVDSLLDYLYRIDEVRGTGRLYLP